MPVKKQPIEEADREHLSRLLWRVTMVWLAKAIGVAKSTVSLAKSGEGSLPDEALQKLRTLRLEDLPKIKKAPGRGRGITIGFSAPMSLRPTHRRRGE